ncbi:alpha/beta fold hydrolase [Planobispora rosea]|uniref:alpha/beta fold hydrolase n=1 Tax=Planobispora rosea TaxID=35762 RepID=UPI00083B4EBB|nr:alpha/beta hydrolase [Planobispora rosea]
MEIRTVTANGIDFGYLETGQGPLALCLHGFPDTAHTWRHLLPALADRGYRAIAPFMRGYAPTSIPADGAYEPGALVADACALHEALGGDGDAVLIGHDWGAFPVYGATAFAPERWRTAVAMAVPPPAAMISAFFDYEQLKRSFYIFLFQTPLAETAAAGEGFIEGLWRDWSPGYDAAQDVAEVRRSLAGPANLAAAIGYYRAMLGTVPPTGRYAAEGAAGGGEVPILYLHGERDGCLHPDLTMAAPQFLPPGSRMKRVPLAGHFLHLERPREVNALILDWLGR